MEIQGHVQNGVVVLDGSVTLPEGTVVTLIVHTSSMIPLAKDSKRIELPLVTGGEPGSLHLTNERIYEILDQEDIEAMKGTWNAPS